MPRGGYHQHAERWGRKSNWQTEGNTRTIRVPETLAEQILELGHKLDRGEIIASDTKSENAELAELRDKLLQMIEAIPKDRELVRSRDAGAVRRALQPLKDLLGDCASQPPAGS